MAETADQETLAAALEADHAGSSAHSMVLFDQAKTAIEAGEFATARERLQKVVDTAADGLVEDLARIRLARTSAIRPQAMRH